MSKSEVNKILLKKVSGLKMAIEKMSDKEKTHLPSVDYGNNINFILDKARDENPDLVEYIPTNVEFGETEYTSRKTWTSWVEIYAKLTQLYELLEY